jgi:hypothetical protein
MPAPKQQGTHPLRRGYIYVKKAHAWLYYENFNQVNIADRWEWYDTEESAKGRYEGR